MTVVIDKMALARELSREDASAGMPRGAADLDDVRAFQQHMQGEGHLDGLNASEVKLTKPTASLNQLVGTPMPESGTSNATGFAALLEPAGMPVKPAALQSTPVTGTGSTPTFESLVQSGAVPVETFKPAVQPTMPEQGAVSMPPLSNLSSGDRVAIESVAPEFLTQQPDVKPVVVPQTDAVKPVVVPQADAVIPKADALKAETSAPAVETQTPVMPSTPEAKPSLDKSAGTTAMPETPVQTPGQTPQTKETPVASQSAPSERAETVRDSVKDSNVKSESATQADSGSKSEQGTKPDAAAKPLDPAIEALFKDFAAMAAHMNGMTAPAAQVAEANAASAPAQVLEGIDLNELVTRILVNTPERGATEVRMTLQDNVLKGTEISLVRGNDGLLTVRLVTDNPASFQTLVAARYDLQAILQQQEGRPVAVVMLDETEREKNDSRRRSKGLYDEKKERDA